MSACTCKGPGGRCKVLGPPGLRLPPTRGLPPGAAAALSTASSSPPLQLEVGPHQRPSTLRRRAGRRGTTDKQVCSNKDMSLIPPGTEYQRADNSLV